MIALWILYALAVGLLATAAAAAVERLLRLWRLPLRGVWALAMLATLAAPLLGRATPDRAATVVAGPVTAMAVEAPAGAPPAPGLLDRLALLRHRLAAEAGRLAGSLAPLDRPLLLAWSAASVLLLLALARSAVVLRRRRLGWERRVVDGHEVLVAPDTGPAVIGAGRARVVLPAWALELDRPLRLLVLRHETEHLRAGDPHLLLGGVVAVVLAPWNLALWWQLARLRLAVELDCDRRVLAAHADVERYGLLLMAVGQRAGGLLRLATPALSEPTRDLERRITAMTARPPQRRLVPALSLAALAALGLAGACMVPSPNQVAGPANAPAPQAQSVGPTSAEGKQAPAGAYFEFQVEQPARFVEGPAPVYPAALRAQNVNGQVIAQYVVDTTGLPIVSTFKVIESSHADFTAAVREAIDGMRFSPATVGGRKVKQLLQQPFVFRTDAGVEAGDAVMPQPTRRPTASPSAAGVMAPSRRGDRMVPLMRDPAAQATAQPTRAPAGTLTPLRRDGAAPTRPGAPDGAYFEYQVEVPVTPLVAVSPVYPAALHAQGVEGQVIAQFVVDAAGVPEAGSFRVIESSHDLFSAAARGAVERTRFVPAQVGGRAVRQVVQQPFVFRLNR